MNDLHERTMAAAAIHYAWQPQLSTMGCSSAAFHQQFRPAPRSFQSDACPRKRGSPAARRFIFTVQPEYERRISRPFGQLCRQTCELCQTPIASCGDAYSLNCGQGRVAAPAPSKTALNPLFLSFPGSAGRATLPLFECKRLGRDPRRARAF